MSIRQGLAASHVSAGHATRHGKRPRACDMHKLGEVSMGPSPDSACARAKPAGHACAQAMPKCYFWDNFDIFATFE